MELPAAWQQSSARYVHRQASALSRLQIRVDWRQTLQKQEAAVKTGSVDPLNRGDAADGALAANPAGRGPGGRELWRSSSMYIPTLSSSLRAHNLLALRQP